MDDSLSILVYLIFFLLVSLCHVDKILCFSLFGCCLYYGKSIVIRWR
ncbi:putative membrane protein [Escherichia coli DEC8E]|nr:putative membrane protein [Escherichia coli DEC8E]